MVVLNIGIQICVYEDMRIPDEHAMLCFGEYGYNPISISSYMRTIGYENIRI